MLMPHGTDIKFDAYFSLRVVNEVAKQHPCKWFRVKCKNWEGLPILVEKSSAAEKRWK